MTKYDYDLFVIGGGSGGVRAARVASNLGLRVGLAEEYRLGGTCVIRGCVPKKLLVYASEFGHEMDDARSYGWSFDNKHFDWGMLVANKNWEISRISAVYRRNLEASGAVIFDSRAEVVGPNTVKLINADREISAARILIATGGHPTVPDIPGAQYGITSNEAFDLEKLPSKIAIVGAGYIAVEFAGIFHGLGVEVELLCRGEEILRGFDADIRQSLTDIMKSQGIKIDCNIDVASIEKTASGFNVSTKRGSIVSADIVMFATGRHANTTGLGLQKLGIECGWNGNIVINDHYQSSVPSIYAVGDVTDRYNLTPVAIRDAMAFIEANYKNNVDPLDLTIVPTAVFSQPEIGTVGLTEQQAREMYRKIDIYKSSFRPLKNTMSGRLDRMLMKIIVDAESDKIVGCHILGPCAAEMTQILAITLKLGVKKSDFDRTIALHPSLAEELVTMHQKWTPDLAKAAG